MEQCRCLRAACLSSATSVILQGTLTIRRVQAAFSFVASSHSHSSPDETQITVKDLERAQKQEEDLAMLHIYILRASGCLIQYLLFRTQSPNLKPLSIYQYQQRHAVKR
jgi:hypothetical protein